MIPQDNKAGSLTKQAQTPIVKSPKITSSKWIHSDTKDDDADKNDKEVRTAKVKGKVKIFIKTVDIDKDKVVEVSILDASNNTELTAANERPKITVGVNKGIAELTIKEGWIHKELKMSITKGNNSGLNLAEDHTGTKKIKISCCEHAIIKGDKGNLIKEINIRLAGFGEFGCPLPQDKFDDRTEKAVKQFQRDYMKVTPTGIICKDFLEKLDKFCEDYYMKIDNSPFKVKCPCVTTKDSTAEDHKCTGFGDKRKEVTYTIVTKKEGEEDKTKEETHKGNEKPGIHRSLLWAISAMKYYLDKVETTDGLTIGEFDSTYRCIVDNIRKKRDSINHMGNAIDMWIYKNGAYPDYDKRQEPCDEVRKLFVKYCGAVVRWIKSNVFCLESSIDAGDGNGCIAPRWVHIDCGKFTNQEDTLYCQNQTELKGLTLKSLYSSKDKDAGKWLKISDCLYVPAAQTKVERVDDIWIGMLNLPDADKKKAIKLNGEKWETNTSTGDRTLRNQCVVEILQRKGDELEVRPEGQDKKGWINKGWITILAEHPKDRTK